MFKIHSTYSMYISYSHVHGLRPEKLSHLIVYLTVSSLFSAPCWKQNYMLNILHIFGGMNVHSSYFSGGPLNDTHYRCFLVLAAAILEYKVYTSDCIRIIHRRSKSEDSFLFFPYLYGKK